MNRSVPPSPGDKARHLMFQPRRSSRSGTPRWFPPDGDQHEQAEPAGDGAVVAVGAGLSPASAPAAAADASADQPAYTELGFDADTGSASEAVADLGGSGSASAGGVTSSDVSAEVADASATSAARAPAAAVPAPAAGQIRAVSVKVPDAAALRPASAGPASADVAAVLVAQIQATEELARRVEELARLRRHDADLVDRLHAENSRLRQGELTEALAPLLRGLIRVHDQMASLGGEDTSSVAGILKSQLLQVLDLTVDVRPFEVPPGTPFDPARHVGVRGVPTDDPELDRTTVRTVKPGFVRGDFAVVRPAETEVYRAD